MNDSDPLHYRAANTVRQWNSEAQADQMRRAEHDARTGGGSAGYGSGPHLSAWTFGAGIIGFAYGMTFGETANFPSMLGYGVLTGLGCIVAMIAMKKAMKGILFIFAMLLLGIKNLLGGFFGFAVGSGGKKGGSTFNGVMRWAFRGGVIGVLIGAGLSLALQDSVGDAALRLGPVGAGIAAFIRVLGLARGSEKTH